MSPKPDLQSPLPLATVAETDAPGTWQSPLPLATVAETDAPGTWQARSTIYYSKVRYSTVQYSTVQYSTVQYSTVQEIVSTTVVPQSQRLIAVVDATV